MTVREDILRRIRQNLGVADQQGRREAAEAWLNTRQRGPQPEIRGSLVERFQEKAEAQASTVHRVARGAEIPAAVAAYLQTHRLGTSLVASADSAGYDWPGHGLNVDIRSATGDDAVGLTGCYCAIAETGTLLLHSGTETPSTISLLPETHLVVLPAARIVATMEDAFHRLRHDLGYLPRALNFISGPSRTGDIEQTLVLGAHGPCRVHIIILYEEFA